MRLCFKDAKPMAGGCCAADGACALPKQHPAKALPAEKFADKSTALEAGILKDTN